MNNANFELTSNEQSFLIEQSELSMTNLKILFNTLEMQINDKLLPDEIIEYFKSQHDMIHAELLKRFDYDIDATLQFLNEIYYIHNESKSLYRVYDDIVTNMDDDEFDLEQSDIYANPKQYTIISFESYQMLSKHMERVMIELKKYNL